MSRIKVLIRCPECGEKYILRGRKNQDVFETGFKMCICNNTDNLEIEEYPT